jgi:hypothetical protein
MNQVPTYIAIAMAFITLLTVFLFFKAAGKSSTVLLILCAWLLVQAIIGLSGFYTVTNVLPPRFLLCILPPILFIAFLFATKRGRAFIDKLDTKTLTLLHVVRIPVELTLWGLFIYKGIPQLMTFEGRNLDILAGITAPAAYYFGFIRKTLSRRLLLIWNFACIALLANIVTLAIASAPFPFQQLAFDQPNVAVLYFPYVWLPACIVPLVLFSHLASIRQLLIKQARNSTDRFSTLANTSPVEA